MPSGVHTKPKPKTTPKPKPKKKINNLSLRLCLELGLVFVLSFSFYLSGVLRWAQISLAYFSGRTHCYLAPSFCVTESHQSSS